LQAYQSYRFEGTLGVGAYLAVVAGVAAGNCNLPAAQNAKGFMGFTADSLTAAQCAYSTLPTVPVYRGRCRAIASAVNGGVITHGHWVRISNANGQIEDCQALVDAAPGTAAEINVIGKAETDTAAAGQQLFVTTQEFVVQIAVS
jgi:hypothetical protein